MQNVNARILLWGIEGAGKTTTLETIHAKLRADLRGDLRTESTRLDPTVTYEALPISLGEIGGVGTQIELIAVPGAPDQVMTRKQLLDEIDGLLLVLDCSPERIEDNFAAIAELRASLEDYGRALDTFPIVLQYNKRDVADPFAIEDLHRRIGLEQAAVFETIATSGHGVLASLTTISKHVVRARRGGSGEIDAATAAAAAKGAAIPDAPIAPPEPVESEAALDMLDALEVVELDPSETLAAVELESAELEAEASPAPTTADLLESAILAEGEAENFQTLGAIEVDLEDDGIDVWSDAEEADAKPDAAVLGADLRIVSVGQASIEADGGVRLPLVLGDAKGDSRSVVLSLRLDALVDGQRDGSDD